MPPIINPRLDLGMMIGELADRPLENISNVTFTVEHLSRSNYRTWVIKGEPSETREWNILKD
jgi:hypothetical protein